MVRQKHLSTWLDFTKDALIWLLLSLKTNLPQMHFSGKIIKAMLVSKYFDGNFPRSYNSLFFLRRSSLAMNRFSLISASSFLPPARTGIGGGSIIEMVLALLTFEEIWVFWVETMFRLILLSLLLLLFWLLLMFATTLLKKNILLSWCNLVID